MKISKKYIKKYYSTFFYVCHHSLIILTLSLFTFQRSHCQNSIVKIFPDDSRPGMFFGQFLKWNDNTAIISAHLDHENGTASGSIYLFDFENNTFLQTQKYFPSDGAIEDYFGYSIGTSGDFLIAGAHHDSDLGASSGAAYILKRSDKNWSLFQKIVPSDGKEADEFGNTVSMHGNWAAICAYLDDDKGTNSGSVYLYQYDGLNWNFHSKVFPLTPESYSIFGFTLELFENLLIVGSPLYNKDGNDKGRAYVFKLQNEQWVQVAELENSELVDLDQLGSEVKITGKFAFVSAIKDDDKGLNSGAVYVFEQSPDSTWIFLQKIVADDGQQGDGFGVSLEANDSELFIGSYFDDDKGTNSGSVYYYKLNNGFWKFAKKIIPDEINEGDAFGASVSLSPNGLLAGSYSDDKNGFFAGSAYFIPRSLLNTFTGNSEQSQYNKFIVYPTLFSDNISIISDENIDSVEYQIVDLTGYIVISGVILDRYKTVDTKEFPSGFYILKLRKNNNISYFRLIKTAF